MKSLRVLHVVTSLDPGGMENGVCNIANGLAGKVDTHIACLEREGAFAARISQPGKVHVLQKRNGFSIRAVLALARLIRRIRPHLLHTHNLGPLIYASLATAGGRWRPIIHGEHAQLAPWELTPRRIRQRAKLHRRCAAIHTVSDSQVAELSSLGFRHPALSAIPNGVDTERFSPGDGVTGKARLSIPEHATTIGLVGRFGPFKRHDVLIEAFTKIAPQFPALHLVFIGGGGSEEQRIRALAATHPRILLAGFHADPAPAYRALDLLVIPSVNEGMSNAALEAMACGIPVLGNIGCGHEQILTDDVDGTIADLGTPEKLAEKIAQIMADPGSLVDMGHAARITVCRRFSLISMLEKYEHLYRAHARA